MIRFVVHCKIEQIVVETEKEQLFQELYKIDGMVSISFGAGIEVSKDFFPFTEKGRAYRIHGLGYRMYKWERED